MAYYVICTNDGELYHHGILGQKWGHRNGPPYPLGDKDHSPREEKAGWRKSLVNKLEYRASKNKAKFQKTKRDKAIQKSYDKAERKIEKNYKSGQALSNKDYQKEIELSKKAQESWRKSDAEYKKDIMAARAAVKDFDKSEKITPKKVSKHREELINKATKNGNKELADIYKNASDKEIAADLQHKQNVRRAVIAAAAIVGVGAAVAIVHRQELGKVLSVANKAASGTSKVSAQDIMKSSWIDINTAQKIAEVSGKGSMLDKKVTADIVKAFNSDFDISISSDTLLKRVDFNKNFDLKKANKLLYVAAAEADNAKYAKVLPNRVGGNERFNVSLMPKSGLKIPGRAETERILSELFDNDPEFQKNTFSALGDMIQKNNPFGIRPERDFIKLVYENLAETGGKAYAINATLGGQNDYLSTEVSKAFKAKGYNAMLDLHDIVDGLSDIPIITLDNNDLVYVGRELIRKW